MLLSIFALATSLSLGTPAVQTASLTPDAPVMTTADTTRYKDYVGKYTVKEAQFETILVTIENGKLMGEAVGQGKSELVADEKVADQFTVLGYDATLTFTRGTDQKVTKVALAIQGQTFEGEKQP